MVLCVLVMCGNGVSQNVKVIYSTGLYTRSVYIKLCYIM